MSTAPRLVRRNSATSERQDVLSIYLRDINRMPLLSREEEKECATLAAQGDEAAKEKLVESNLRFVVKIAKQYQNQGLPLIDLINEGNIGLMKAVEKFDVTRGYHFISYAVWWIRQAILKAIYGKSRMIRLPFNRVYELMKIARLRNKLQSENAAKPQIAEIAQKLDMDKDQVENLINISQELVSLERPISDEKDSASVSDFLEDESTDDPEQVAIDASLKSDVNNALKTLTEKESSIIQYRFGLNGKTPMSLQEIGNKYNLTKERIRQIEKRALKKLRHPMRSQRLKSYIS